MIRSLPASFYEWMYFVHMSFALILYQHTSSPSHRSEAMTHTSKASLPLNNSTNPCVIRIATNNLLGDDLSMFLAVGAVMNQVLTFDKTPSQRLHITLTILGTIIPVSIYHCWADEIILHEVAFGLMVFITGRKIRRLIRERVKSPEAQKRLKSMASIGTGTFTFSVIAPLHTPVP